MRFARPSRRPLAESVVPMINVVFLLLIFFMMSARIAPPPPFDLALPASESDGELTEDMTLYLGPDGAVGFRGQLGAAAWAALSGEKPDQRLVIRADATLPAPELARVLADLAGLGIRDVDLAVRAP